MSYQNKYRNESYRWNSDSIEKLCSIYENKRLNILGTYSHLCVADSSKAEDIDFTKIQIKNLMNVLQK